MMLGWRRRRMALWCPSILSSRFCSLPSEMFASPVIWKVWSRRSIVASKMASRGPRKGLVVVQFAYARLYNM
jgi:hypothetical protein